MRGWIEGLVLLAAGAAFFLALRRYLPGLIVKKLHAAFEAARTNQWMRAKTHRARLLAALVRFLEEEVPDPGTGKEFYAALGDRVAALPITLSASAPVFSKASLIALGAITAGSGPKWAKVLESIGDAVDTELDDELKELAAEQPPAA